LSKNLLVKADIQKIRYYKDSLEATSAILMTNSRVNIFTVLAIGTTVVFWASAFVGIRYSLQDYSPQHLAIFRYFIASLVLAFIALIKPIRIPLIDDLPRILLMGFLGIAAYNVVLNYGELSVTAGAASFIVNSGPIITTILSIRLLGERVNRAGVISMLIGFFGIGLIAIGEGAALQFKTGTFLVLLAAILQSFYFVLQKPLLERYNPFEIVSYAIWSGTFFMLILSNGIIDTIRTASVPGTLSVIYMGIFPGALGYFTWSYVLSKMQVSKASYYLYIIPVVAIAISYFWLSEVPSWISLIGGLITLSGVIGLNIRGKKLIS